jgi:hypothetical protein
VVLTNTGTAATTITEITVSDDYEIDHDCPLAPETLAAGAACTVTVIFSPTGSGAPIPGRLVFTDTAGTGTQAVQLNGYPRTP